MMRVPFIVGIAPLFLLFLFTFLSWYWLMGNLFTYQKFAEALAVGYSLPVVFTLSAYILSKTKRLTPIMHFISLAVLGILYFIMASLYPQNKIQLFSPEAVVGISFVSVVMSMMLYSITESGHYFKYKTLFFISGVIFMSMFIVIAVFGLTVSMPIMLELQRIRETERLNIEQFILLATKELTIPAYVLITVLIGFWASAAGLVYSKTQGQYVKGLELGEMFAFRPDLILPGGVNFVKGVLLTGIGLILMLHITPALPQWNWWGFILAFWGIMILIPIRGVFKMILRRERLLGNTEALGMRINFIKELLLFFGLLILLYGFLNAFRGVVPFTIFIPSIEDWPAAIPAVISFIILVPLRMWYKSLLVEGAETKIQLFFKQLLLWIGVIFLIYSYAFAFRSNMHIHTTSLNFATNPLDFTIGISLFALGAALILGVRPLALRNELIALLRIMPGILASLSEEKRLTVMQKRLYYLATCSEQQRLVHIKYMIEGLEAIPSEQRLALRKSMLETMAKLPNEKRSILMSTMDKILFG